MSLGYIIRISFVKQIPKNFASSAKFVGTNWLRERAKLAMEADFY